MYIHVHVCTFKFIVIYYDVWYILKMQEVFGSSA